MRSGGLALRKSEDIQVGTRTIVAITLRHFPERPNHGLLPDILKHVLERLLQLALSAKPFFKMIRDAMLEARALAPLASANRPDGSLRKRFAIDFDGGALSGLQKGGPSRFGGHRDLLDGLERKLQVAIGLQRINERVESVEPDIAPQLGIPGGADADEMDLYSGLYTRLCAGSRPRALSRSGRL